MNKPIKHLFDATLTQPDPEFAQKLRRTVPGMAHFAGTGPIGKTCGMCGHLSEVTHRGRRIDRCAKFTELMQVIGGSVPKHTPACRYFSPKGQRA